MVLLSFMFVSHLFLVKHGNMFPYRNIFFFFMIINFLYAFICRSLTVILYSQNITGFTQERMDSLINSQGFLLLSTVISDLLTSHLFEVLNAIVVLKECK